MLGEILREPAFSENEFEIMKRRSLAMSARTRTEPSALAANRLSRALAHYAADDVRYVPTPEENDKRTEAVALDQVIGLYGKMNHAEPVARRPRKTRAQKREPRLPERRQLGTEP